MGLLCLGLDLRHTVCKLHVQFILAYVAKGVLLPLTAHGAYGLYLTVLGVAECAFRCDKVPLPAPPHFHGHQLRFLQGVLGLVSHVAFCFVPAHNL